MTTIDDVMVKLEMKPESGSVNLSETVLLLIDMQVRGAHTCSHTKKSAAMAQRRSLVLLFLVFMFWFDKNGNVIFSNPTDLAKCWGTT